MAAMEEKEIDLREYWELIWRRRWLVLVFTFLAALIAFVVNFIQDPVYEAKTTVLFESQGGVNQLLESAGVLVPRQGIQTQAKLVESRAVIERAAANLGMDKNGADTVRGSISVSVIRGTDLIEIKARANSPEEAKKRADATAQAFVDYGVEEQARAVEQEIRYMEGQLEKLRREVADPEIYSRLAAIRTELELTRAVRGANTLRIVDKADLPTTPVGPRTQLNTLLGLLTGLMLGTMVAFGMGYFDRTLRSESEIRRRFDLPILGRLPYSPQNSVILKDNPGSGLAEAFRLLATNLSFVSPDHPLKSILVTSPGAGEGKTTVSLNLAEALSWQGKRVVVVECDLRRPRLARRLTLPRDKGLSLLLASAEQGAKNGEHIFEVEGISVLPAGVIPPSPVELLSSQKMRQLLSNLGAQYDFIVIDTPPMLGVADALVLAPLVEGVMLVVDLGTTRWDATEDTLLAFKQSGIKLLGLTVNGIRSKGRGYRYYYYNRYYGDTRDKARH